MVRGLAQSVARNSASGCDAAPARHGLVVERDPSNVGCAQNLPLAAPCRWTVADPEQPLSACASPTGLQRLQSAVTTPLNSRSRSHTGRSGVDETCDASGRFQGTAEVARRRRAQSARRPIACPLLAATKGRPVTANPSYPLARQALPGYNERASLKLSNMTTCAVGVSGDKNNAPDLVGQCRPQRV